VESVVKRKLVAMVTMKVKILFFMVNDASKSDKIIAKLLIGDS